MKKWLAVIVGLVVLMVFLLWWRDGDEAEGTHEVTTAAVDRGEILQTVSAIGSVRALITVEVGSQLSGQIDEVLVDFNTPVEAGQLLARIDPQTFERRVQEAEANLAVARANIAVQQATIDRAQANFDNSRQEFERQQRLVDRGSVSEQALDNAEAAFKSAQADLAIARAQLQNAEANVVQREASLDSAQIDLERTDIRSPIDGVVINREVDPGQTVAASFSAPLMFLIAQDLTRIQIEANVDEADIGEVREGAEAEFRVDAFPDRVFRGQVDQVRLSPIEEQNVVTYTVIVTAANPDRRLLPGMTASVDIVTGQRTDVLRVDNEALRLRPPETLLAEAEGAATPVRGGPPGRGRGGGGSMMAAMFEGLELDEATRERIQTDIRTAIQPIAAGFANPDADRDALRQRMSDAVSGVMRQNLNDEQYERYLALQREAEQTRPGTLYVQRGDGLLETKAVRLGIGDGEHTELVSGDFSDGDEVIVRVRSSE